jgi:D-glycero-D-manno-heptose 1,7-bisphosphate phosphatase
MKAVFLDRDGVINELVYYEEAGIIDSPFTVEQFHILPGVGKAIRSLNKAGFLVLVASNQPGIAKNHFTLSELDEMNLKMTLELEKENARVDKAYYCTHHPEAPNLNFRTVCSCRKPEPGLLLHGIREYSLNPAECFMVGDNLTDIQAGQRAGCRSILLGKQKCELCRLMEKMEVYPDAVAANLGEAVEMILEMREINGDFCRFGEH